MTGHLGRSAQPSIQSSEYIGAHQARGGEASFMIRGRSRRFYGTRTFAP